MRHNETKKQYLPVPPQLRPVADQIAATRIPLNRTLLDTDVAHEDPAGPAARARRLLNQRASDLGQDVYYSGDLAVSARSHALVEISGLRHSYHLFRNYLAVPAGYTLRTVDVAAVPFAALAHLAADAQLAAAIASGDVYTWLADRIGVTRTDAKQGLFGLLAGTPLDRIGRRIAASGRNPETALSKIATIPQVFPDTFAWVAHVAPYIADTSPVSLAQMMTSRVAHSALAEAHRLLTEAGVPATAAVLADPEGVVYLVPDNAVEQFTRTLEGLHVTREGITMAVYPN